MALYTHLSRTEITYLASRFGLPAPQSSRGILQGTVNTYYRLNYPDGSHHLKIDEVGDLARLRRELAVLQTLKTRRNRIGFQTPIPETTTKGKKYFPFRNRFVLLFKTIPGKPVMHRSFSPGEMRQIGEAVARLHMVPVRSTMAPHRFHLPELFRIYSQIRKKLRRKHPAIDLKLRQWVAWLKVNQPKKVRSGLIHADLFPENILFDGGLLEGIVDFEAAGLGPFLFDIATTLHACCHGKKGFSVPPARAFLAAYQRVRKLNRTERTHVAYFLTQSAVRFLLTRLRDFELKESSVRAKPFKDYREYLNRLPQIQHSLVSLSKIGASL